jgi:hypothetical protein
VESWWHGIAPTAGQLQALLSWLSVLPAPSGLPCMLPLHRQQSYTHSAERAVACTHTHRPQAYATLAMAAAWGAGCAVTLACILWAGVALMHAALASALACWAALAVAGRQGGELHSFLCNRRYHLTEMSVFLNERDTSNREDELLPLRQSLAPTR